MQLNTATVDEEIYEKNYQGVLFFWQNFLGCDKLFLGATSFFGVRLVKTGGDKLFEVVTFFFFWRPNNFWEELENFWEKC